MRCSLASGLLVLTLAPPALAGTWTPPEGCEAYVTVQARGCVVSHQFRCERDAPGDQWRVDIGVNGPFFYSRIDAEGQWLQSMGQTQQFLDPAPADPASLSDLIGTGLDTSDFTVSRDDGTASRYKGYDKLTGREVVIDGVTLQETELEFTEYDANGKVIGRKRGNEFVHPEWRIFLGGTGEEDLGDGRWLPFNFSPVEFDFPGDAGFLADQPKYDCDVLTASLPFVRVSHEP